MYKALIFFYFAFRAKIAFPNCQLMSPVLFLLYLLATGWIAVIGIKSESNINTTLQHLY